MSNSAQHSFDFAPSADMSLGVELELQLIDAETGDLAQRSPQILQAARLPRPLARGAIVPEVSAGMIEISTGVCANACEVATDLESLRSRVSCAAAEHGARISGGGLHPSKHWSEQQIFDSPRYRDLTSLYGEVLKQTTVFGQHIHLGCADVERVPLLMHQLARYVPHFIALSASSPFMEGRDTGFDSTRTYCPNPFPTGPRAPFTNSWHELTEYLSKWLACGVIKSIKDLHWDIRPKPEYGTVEIRVLDSPLSIERAAALASFAQLLGTWLLESQPFIPRDEDYLVYEYNKYQAAKFGLQAIYVDPMTRKQLLLRDHLGNLLSTLARHASAPRDEERLATLRKVVSTIQNDATVLRSLRGRCRSVKEMALLAAGMMETSPKPDDAVRASMPLLTAVPREPLSVSRSRWA